MGTMIEKAHGLAAVPQRYRMGLVTGIIGAGIAGGSEFFQFRWTDTTKYALIRQVRLSVGNLGTAFAAGGFTFDMAVASAWTAAGTGGGVATITGLNGTVSPNNSATAVAEIRTATTAALTAGTKTLQAQAIGSVCGGVPAVAGTFMLPPTDLFAALSEDEMPLILDTNAGFALRATVPATGTWTAGIMVRWDEIGRR